MQGAPGWEVRDAGWTRLGNCKDREAEEVIFQTRNLGLDLGETSRVGSLLENDKFIQGKRTVNEVGSECRKAKRTPKITTGTETAWSNCLCLFPTLCSVTSS